MPRPVQTSAELVDALPPFLVSDEVAGVAAAVIREHEVSFGWIPRDFRVVYLLKFGDKISPDDEIDTIAKCVKAPALWNVLAAYDFAIWVKDCYWNLLSPRDREAVLAHELQHIGATDAEKPKILPHTIEEFSQVVAWYGPWSGGLKALYRAFAESGHEPARQVSAGELVDAVADAYEAAGAEVTRDATGTPTIHVDMDEPLKLDAGKVVELGNRARKAREQPVVTP